MVLSLFNNDYTPVACTRHHLHAAHTSPHFFATRFNALIMKTSTLFMTMFGIQEYTNHNGAVRKCIKNIIIQLQSTVSEPGVY